MIKRPAMFAGIVCFVLCQTKHKTSRRYIPIFHFFFFICHQREIIGWRMHTLYTHKSLCHYIYIYIIRTKLYHNKLHIEWTHRGPSHHAKPRYLSHVYRYIDRQIDTATHLHTPNLNDPSGGTLKRNQTKGYSFLSYTLPCILSVCSIVSFILCFSFL